MLSHLLKRHAADRPQNVALVEGEVRLTWHDLDQRVSRLANGLWQEGVRDGDAVGVVLPNGCSFVATFLALARIGAVAVPVNPEFKEPEVGVALAEAECLTAVVDGRFAPLCERMRAAGLLQSVIVDEPQLGLRALDNLFADRASSGSIPIPPEDAAVVRMFTSGTTGKPKRIIRTHAQLISLAEAYQDALGTSSLDRLLAVVPLSHGHGLCSSLLASLQAGATLFVQRRFDRRETLRILSRERVTLFSAVPFIFSVLADTNTAEPVDLSALRLAITGGAPLKRETWNKVHERLGISLRQSYGSVETGALTVNMEPDSDATSESVGRPLNGVRVKILDDSAAPLPTGTIGEIVVQSPAASDCCLHSDTKSTLCDEDGWIRMNDLGRLDSDGRLYVTGRNRQDINVAGQKVNPREVEECILSHPAAREAVAVPSRDAWGEEAVKVVVVTNKKCSLNELVAHCRKQLADYKLPRFIEFRDGVPGGDQPLRDEFTD